MKSVFSIIVTAYNEEKYIRKCVDSVLSQSFEAFELILVDDGSPDRCPEILDEYAAVDNRVTVIHKKNGGLVSARKAGLERAAGEYVLYVDGDDWLAKNALSTFYEKAVVPYRPDMIIYNMTRVYGNSTRRIPVYVKEGLYTGKALEEYIKPRMMYDSGKPFYHGLVFPSCGGKILRRTLLLEHFCKDERIRMGEDNAYLFECIYYAESVFFCDDSFYMYNQENGNSFKATYDPTRFENNQLLFRYIEAHLGGKEKYLDFQINAFKAYWVIMAVFHEVKCGRGISEARKHISRKIMETEALAGIDDGQLPVFARGFLLLLRLRFYTLALIGAKLVAAVRG